MNLDILAAIAYGLLALIGGIIGYVQASSKASLISGVISGVILLLSAVVQFQGMDWGYWLALIVTGLLIVVFAVRLNKTRKFMPAGLMAIAGITTLLVMVLS